MITSTKWGVFLTLLLSISCAQARTFKDYFKQVSQNQEFDTELRLRQQKIQYLDQGKTPWSALEIEIEVEANADIPSSLLLKQSYQRGAQHQTSSELTSLKNQQQELQLSYLKAKLRGELLQKWVLIPKLQAQFTLIDQRKEILQELLQWQIHLQSQGSGSQLEQEHIQLELLELDLNQRQVQSQAQTQLDILNSYLAKSQKLSLSELQLEESTADINPSQLWTELLGQSKNEIDRFQIHRQQNPLIQSLQWGLGFKQDEFLKETTPLIQVGLGLDLRSNRQALQSASLKDLEVNMIQQKRLSQQSLNLQAQKLRELQQLEHELEIRESQIKQRSLKQLELAQKKYRIGALSLMEVTQHLQAHQDRLSAQIDLKYQIQKLKIQLSLFGEPSK